MALELQRPCWRAHSGCEPRVPFSLLVAPPQFLPHDVAHDLEDMLAHDGGAATIKIHYRPYDWGVNTAEY